MNFENWLLWTSFVVSFALGQTNQDVEMPLITNGDVPLVAKLDTTILDRNIKDYVNVTAEKKINDTIANLKKNILNEILSSKYISFSSFFNKYYVEYKKCFCKLFKFQHYFVIHLYKNIILFKT